MGRKTEYKTFPVSVLPEKIKEIDARQKSWNKAQSRTRSLLWDFDFLQAILSVGKKNVLKKLEREKMEKLVSVFPESFAQGLFDDSGVEAWLVDFHGCFELQQKICARKNPKKAEEVLSILQNILPLSFDETLALIDWGREYHSKGEIG